MGTVATIEEKTGERASAGGGKMERANAEELGGACQDLCRESERIFLL